VIEAADHLILLGPGGGRDGGRVIYEGPPGAFLASQPEFFVATGSPRCAAGDRSRDPAALAASFAPRKKAVAERSARRAGAGIAPALG